MILKSITLENIRSYRDNTTIEFRVGTTLFEGDVASGKSTILSAIEFALFGLGDLNGSFMLRNGAVEGHVTLGFEADGRDYQVHRSLVRKGENVRSGESYIEEQGEREKYAARELKEKVLQILRFNESSNPRAQSVIYRYAIFTPQEAMKDIIERDSDTRLETLRKAYGIEHYRTAAQNAASISTEFRVKIAALKTRTGDVDKVRKALEEARSRTEALTGKLEASRKAVKKLGDDLEAKKLERAVLEEKKAEMGKAQGKIPILDRQIRDKEGQRKVALGEVEAADRKLSGYTSDISNYEAIPNPSPKDERTLEEESTSITDQVTELRNKRSRLSERLQNFEDILSGGRCPICEREYEADRVTERKAHIEGELVLVDREVARLEGEKRSVEETIKKLERYADAQKELKRLRETVSELRQRSDAGSRLVKTLDAELLDLNEQLRQATRASEPMRKIEVEVERLDDQLRRLERERSTAAQLLGGIESELKRAKTDTDTYAEQLREKEALLRVLALLEEDRVWLSNYFAPTVEVIEKQALANRNQRFNEQFQKWFQMLVDDPDLMVRVREDFSPVIEREGYEQDYGQLSGGERTSVALAYRLALNTTVQETALGQEPNLLILDEPTDGFSKEQLAKLGDILTELRCPQVILVSHERELESLADRVYRIEKVNGESTVAVTAPYQK